jgi:fucose 4-O-acetylase-like acetyltransferase
LYFVMQRRLDLDRAKGLAILLVVFGHIVARADPPGVEWYEPLRRAVYAFHMPFFLYLSGLAAAWSGAAFAPPRGWARLAVNRTRRLLVPFFGMGFCIVLIKLSARHFMFVDHTPPGWGAALDGLFWHTRDGPARSIWYVFVLFVFSVAAPVLIWLDGGRARLLLAVGAAVYVLPVPALLYADDAARYAVFFAAGVAAGAAGAAWDGFVDRAWRRLAWVFAGILLLAAAPSHVVAAPAILFAGGFISMPVIHGFVRSLPKTAAKIFLWLGRYSFMIYLFNTLFIGLAKGLLLRVTSWDGPHFLPVAVALVLSGTLGPVALKEALFRRSKNLDRLTS